MTGSKGIDPRYVITPTSSIDAAIRLAAVAARVGQEGAAERLAQLQARREQIITGVQS